MTCTTTDCGNETSTYLCGQCVSDLQAWVDEAHQLAPELTVTIAKQDVLRRAGNTGGGGGKAGSAAPINLDAVQLQMNLQSVARDAATYATDQHAAGIATLIQEWCKTAERLISGLREVRIITRCECGGNVLTDDPPPTPSSVNPDPADTGKCQSCGIAVSVTKRDTIERIADNAPDPMKGRQLVAWVRQNAGYNIALTDVRNWAREGLIHRTNDTTEGHPTYAVQDVLRITYRKMSSGKGRQLAS